MSRRIRVYIAGPITKGDLADNVNQATRAFVELAKAGFAPFCPHWSVYANEAVRGYVAAPDGELSKQVYAVATANGNPSMSHDDWLGVDLAWVECADAVLRLPGDSVGAAIECRHAQSVNIPVYHSVESLVAECRSVMNNVANAGRAAEEVRQSVDRFLQIVSTPPSCN